jgi:orotidine-5'-phosphate decarboxylase
MAGSLETRAVALARLAKKTGMDGVVCSAHEARAIRRACGPKFVILIPGVRPRSGAANDQSRIATPAEAIRAGADYLVIGRPITAARDPRSAVLAIVNEIRSAMRHTR